MSRLYDTAVVIGRFQPFHKGHYEIILQAALKARKVLVLIGSSNKPRTYKNPWTYDERAQMIKDSFEGSTMKYVVHTAPLIDYIYNDRKWMNQVITKIYLFNADQKLDNSKTVIVGHDKDSSSWYLKAFPQFHILNCENHQGINATDIRKAWFGPEVRSVKELVTSGSFEVIESTTNETLYLVEEAQVIKKYKESWDKAPWPYTLSCVDAVVESPQGFLMVKRAQAPGKGLWALPGGFVDVKETLLQSCIRELQEETGLSKDNLLLQTCRTFDHPDRGDRGRTFTTAFYFKTFIENVYFEESKDGEVSESRFISYKDLSQMRNLIYQDHLDIISYFDGNREGLIDESYFGY